MPAALPALGLSAALIFVALRIGSLISSGRQWDFDRGILLALRVPGHTNIPIGPYWVHKLMLGLTALGSGAVLMPLVLIVIALLLVRRHIRTALYLAAATSSGALLVDILKGLFHRARPDLVDHLVAASNFSFPSGHSTNSAIVYLSIGALLTRVERWPLERRLTIALAAALAIAIGVSRIYLGVHWPSDVAAGWMLGTAWAMLWWTLAGRGSIPRPT